MPRGKKPNKDQLNMFEFHFNFNSDDCVKTVEGGSQENLSDFEFYLRKTLKETLDRCAKREADPLDRVEVAARMTRMLGRDITKSHIDQWTAMSTVQRRIHVDSLKALCEVTGDYAPMHAFVESCGFKALHPEEAKAAEYGAKMFVKRMLDAELKDILSDIDEADMTKRLMARMGAGQ